MCTFVYLATSNERSPTTKTKTAWRFEVRLGHVFTSEECGIYADRGVELDGPFPSVEAAMAHLRVMVTDCNCEPEPPKSIPPGGIALDGWRAQ
jgi:hypothetical protein